MNSIDSMNRIDAAKVIHRSILVSAWIIGPSALFAWSGTLLLGLPIGSPEVLILFILVATAIALLIKTLQFRGTFRFVSLLIWTSVIAIVASIFVPPWKQKTLQNEALAKLYSNGGRAQIMPLRYRDVEGHAGWSQTRNGWLCPTVLHYLYEKHLMPEQLWDIEIPTRLLTRDILDSLRLDPNSKLLVMLDGKSVPSSILQRHMQLRESDMRVDGLYFDSWVSFRAGALTPIDVDFLSSIPASTFVLDIDTQSENLQLLKELNRNALIRFDFMPKNVSSLSEIGLCEACDTFVCRSPFIASELLQGLEGRTSPITLRIEGCNLTAAQWSWLSSTSKVRSLILNQVSIAGGDVQWKDLEELQQNEEIESMVYSAALMPSSDDLVASFAKMKGLKKLKIFGLVVDRLQLDAIENSAIEELELEFTTPEFSSREVRRLPWIRRMKRLVLNGENMLYGLKK